MEALLLC